MYAMLCTRPDVSYALSIMSRYQANPGEQHWGAVKTILKYLRRTKDVFLTYGDCTELKVIGYCDASFQTDKDDSRFANKFSVYFEWWSCQLEKLKAVNYSRFYYKSRVYCSI